MKKISNSVNHSNKLMLTYFFCAINIYFKTKHSNETFHLGFFSLLNDFSYRKHINSKSKISALTISGKSWYIKIVAPYPPRFYYQPTPSPFYGIVSIFPEGHFIMTSPRFSIFFQNNPSPCLYDPPTIKHRRVYKLEKKLE